MPFDEQNRGDPFRGDFPDWLDQASPGSRADVQRQVTELTQSRYEPAIRHELLRLMQRRRALPAGALPAGELPADERSRGRADAGRTRATHDEGGVRHEVVQFDYLPVEVGFDTLLARGELLITVESYEGHPSLSGRAYRGSGARSYLDELGFEPRDVECEDLRDKIVKLTHHGRMTPQELADVAKNLRIRGFNASVTNISPTAPVIKQPPDPVPAPQGTTLRTRLAPGAAQGLPVKVAVIDTGITDQARADGLLAEVTRTSDNIDHLYTFPLRDPQHEFLDFDAGHGTFVAGIVRQIAPIAEITAYRAVDSDGIGSEVTVACQMIQAVRDGNQIINLSLGCQTQDDFPPVALAAAMEVIEEVERDTDAANRALIVAAAGNHADSRPCWPAAFPRVVSVAGLAPDLMPAQWSTRGFWITCSTIGQGVSSTFVTGRESPLIDPDASAFGPDAWAVWSGTSFAAPQITGALARLREETGRPLREVLRMLLSAGLPTPDFGQALKILPGG